MSQLSGNSCNIITLLPLGLDCDNLNASTPDDTNGIVTLYITGGTPPYNVSWDNGSQGTLLTNLSPGDYTAIVTDYYGDFTASTTCTVGFDSFYIEEFEDCKNNNKIYYLADLPSIFTTGKTYELTTQVGCWTSSGTTLYTGQTYFNSFAQISSGPYDTCEECLPAPTPEPTYPPILCLRYLKGENTISQATIYSGSTINGYPSWTSATPSYVVYYNTGNTRWEVSGWTSEGNPGQPVFINPTAPPTGTWTVLGTSNTVIIDLGVCAAPILRLSFQKTDPTCTNTSNGSINISPAGGVPPYTYSIDGVNYQSGNIFAGLAGGVYTVYLKGFANTIVSQSVTLTPQQTFQNYNINLTPINTSTALGFGNTTTKTHTFRIEVVPALPPTNTLNFTLPISFMLTGNTTIGAPIVFTTQSSNLTFTPNGTATITGPTIGTPTIVGPNPKPSPCIRVNVTTTAYTETYQGTITGNGYIIGSIVQSVTTPRVFEKVNGCPLVSSVKNTINLTNANLTSLNCSHLNGVVTPLQYENFKIGQFLLG